MTNDYCILCGKELTEKEGCNPDPIILKEGAKCCGECDRKFVQPARFDTLPSETVTPNGKVILKLNGNYALFEKVISKRK